MPLENLAAIATEAQSIQDELKTIDAVPAALRARLAELLMTLLDAAATLPPGTAITPS